MNAIFASILTRYAGTSTVPVIAAVHITPEVAAAMLTRNEVNRRLRTSIVARYATEMRQGAWDSDNPHGIVFNRDAVLADGQHRLTAICESGCAQTMMVIFNSDAKYNTPMDRGACRTVADITGESARRVAVASVIGNLLHGASFSVTPARVESILRNYGSSIDWAFRALRFRRRLPCGMMAGFAFAHARAPDVAETFALKFFNMEGGAKSPIRTLLDFKEREVNASIAERRHAALAVLRCMHAFATHRPLSRLTQLDLGLAFFIARRAA